MQLNNQSKEKMANDDLVLTAILDLKSAVGKMDGKLDASLLAHTNRLEVLEGRLDGLESDTKWQWRIHAATAPFIIGFHAITKKLGW